MQLAIRSKCQTVQVKKKISEDRFRAFFFASEHLWRSFLGILLVSDSQKSFSEIFCFFLKAKKTKELAGTVSENKTRVTESSKFIFHDRLLKFYHLFFEFQYKLHLL